MPPTVAEYLSAKTPEKARALEMKEPVVRADIPGAVDVHVTDDVVNVTVTNPTLYVAVENEKLDVEITNPEIDVNISNDSVPVTIERR